mmetsp:Transcript_12554/g.27540  ORF Transcript_12554/g.27540 Transcript_12554/m.27540 type:complete len:227 (+) Transcript_12554:447-1127(+)
MILFRLTLESPGNFLDSKLSSTISTQSLSNWTQFSSSCKISVIIRCAHQKGFSSRLRFPLGSLLTTSAKPSDGCRKVSTKISPDPALTSLRTTISTTLVRPFVACFIRQDSPLMSSPVSLCMPLPSTKHSSKPASWSRALSFSSSRATGAGTRPEYPTFPEVVATAPLASAPGSTAPSTPAFRHSSRGRQENSRVTPDASWNWMFAPISCGGMSISKRNPETTSHR